MPIIGNEYFARKSSIADAVAVLHATTIAFTPCSINYEAMAFIRFTMVVFSLDP